MNTIRFSFRSFVVVLSLAGATFLAGCNAASLAGPEPTPVQNEGGDGNGGGNGGDSHDESDPRNI
ncbi:MAG: hypothetical protein R2834_17585 [Rhodothermales bacterium]